MSAFPPSLWTAINDSHHNFITADRGHLRAANDQTFDTRITHFHNWIHSFSGVDSRFLQMLSQGQALAIIGTYMQALKDGDNYKQLDDLCTNTIMGYSHTAALYLETQYKITVPLYIQRGGTQKQNTINPFLLNLLADRRN